jgi:hypothetical protein
MGLASQHGAERDVTASELEKGWILVFVEFVFGEIHTEGQAFVGEEFFDFDEGFFTEVAELEQFVGFVLDEFCEGIDFSCFEAVVGANGEVEIFEGGFEQFAHVEDMFIHDIIFFRRFVVEGDVFIGDEHQVVNEDAGCVFDGIFGMDGAIGFDLDG